eukprot:12153891-Alexandrium_andersonii.AAC.1
MSKGLPNGWPELYMVIASRVSTPWQTPLSLLVPARAKAARAAGILAAAVSPIRTRTRRGRPSLAH